MTATNNKLIGQSGQLAVERGQLKVTVTIKDVRQAYGRTDVLVQPSDGAGEGWFNVERVKIK